MPDTMMMCVKNSKAVYTKCKNASVIYELVGLCVCVYDPSYFYISAMKI